MSRWALGLVLLLAAGCSDDVVSSCPNDLPDACTDGAIPSYASEIEPLFEAKCNPCHGMGGGDAGSRFDFSSYDNIHTEFSTILNQVFSCRMPPGGAMPLLPEERAELLSWLVCRAPNN